MSNFRKKVGRKEPGKEKLGSKQISEKCNEFLRKNGLAFEIKRPFNRPYVERKK